MANSVPDTIRLYHITHIGNLPSIVEAGKLLSDSQMAQQNKTHKIIGYGHIKSRRKDLSVSCHEGTTVGQYVPFYFCPRSPMLFVINKKSERLDYKEGQEKIVHLVADMKDVVKWANKNQVKWAFSSGNAATELADFYSDLSNLDKINWSAVKDKYWQNCRDEKQSEFLIHDCFPIHLFKGIGTINSKIKEQVQNIVSVMENPLAVGVRDAWYY